MSRGRHRVELVRRPLALPVVGVAVAATMLAGPLLLAAVPAGPAAPDLVTMPSEPAQAEADAFQLYALEAREQAQASRSRERATASPSVVAEAPVEPPAPAPEPSVPAEPTQPAEPPAVTGTLWATSEVNVRSGPAADTERIGYLAALDQVDVSGVTEDDWTQVVIDGRGGWVNSSYLSQTEPTPEPEPEPDAEPAPEAASSDASCSINPGIEPNLSGNARAVYRAVCAEYGGSVSGFGGYRPGDGGDHGSGRAVDIMVSGEAGWEISRFLQARAGELGISYLIYEQQYWPAGSSAGAWEYMEDRGSATANHYDHVHVSVR
ncbi:SH3 domain-containing protein [Aquipuribacter sp. MA13-6]|uniref:SH3 domain-containing protein n=1 Tax=unclassified Aquipuribacter TaxID=2635084 RepID=UPI003EE8A12E